MILVSFILKYTILEHLEIDISVHWYSYMVPKWTPMLQTVSFNGSTFLKLGPGIAQYSD